MPIYTSKVWFIDRRNERKGKTNLTTIRSYKIGNGKIGFLCNTYLNTIRHCVVYRYSAAQCLENTDKSSWQRKSIREGRSYAGLLDIPDTPDFGVCNRRNPFKRNNRETVVVFVTTARSFIHISYREPTVLATNLSAVCIFSLSSWSRNYGGKIRSAQNRRNWKLCNLDDLKLDEFRY